MPIDLPLPAARRPVWGTAASFALHGGLALLLLAMPLRQLVVLPPVPVAVQIVTPAEFAALQPQTPAPPPLAAPADATAPVSGPLSGATASRTVPPPAPRTGATITATQFYAAGILQEPGMERIRKAFDSLASSEQLVQLCNIEGLEQIRRGAPAYDPDTLVGYAMADPVVDGLTLIATGGAFRSRRQWYRIAFRCTVGADLASVTAFAFTPGDVIPEDQWDAHDLNAADAEE